MDSKKRTLFNFIAASSNDKGEGGGGWSVEGGPRLVGSGVLLNGLLCREWHAYCVGSSMILNYFS